jgi:hypothetical protein
MMKAPKRATKHISHPLRDLLRATSGTQVKNSGMRLGPHIDAFRFIRRFSPRKIMNHATTQPGLSEEGITFTVVVDSIKRECLITPQALYKLSSLKSDDADTNIMEIFRSFESNIMGIARRLVAAGVAGTPLVMRPETFTSPRTR